MLKEYKPLGVQVDLATLEKAGSIPTTCIVRTDFAGEGRTCRWMGEGAVNRAESVALYAGMPKRFSQYITETWVDWLSHIVMTRNCNEFSGKKCALSEDNYRQIDMEIGNIRAERLGTRYVLSLRCPYTLSSCRALRFNKDSDDKALYWTQVFYRQMFSMDRTNACWTFEKNNSMTVEEALEFYRVYGTSDENGNRIEVPTVESDSEWSDMD